MRRQAADPAPRLAKQVGSNDSNKQKPNGTSEQQSSLVSPSLSSLLPLLLTVAATSIDLCCCSSSSSQPTAAPHTGKWEGGYRVQWEGG